MEIDVIAVRTDGVSHRQTCNYLRYFLTESSLEIQQRLLKAVEILSFHLTEEITGVRTVNNSLKDILLLGENSDNNNDHA